MDGTLNILPGSFISFLGEAWTIFVGWVSAWYETVMDWRLLTSGRASLIIVVVVALFFLPIVHLYFRSIKVGKIALAAGFLAIPLALVLLLQTPTGFVGTPDDNCTAYERGKMTFSLLDVLVISKEKADIYGDAWLMLFVQNDRWGSDVHECRIASSDPKARTLAKVIHDASLQNEGSTRFSRGQFTFSFGGHNEVPNVKIKGLKPLKKPYPPEGPRAAPPAPLAAPPPAVPQQNQAPNP